MKEFRKKVQEQFDKMVLTGKLFRVKLSGKEIWDLYLKSFSPEDDPIFRDPNSSIHNCNQCNNFFRRYSNIVAINSDGNLMTLFDFTISGKFENTVKVLSQTVKNSEIENVFFETYSELNSINYESVKPTYETFKLGIEKNVKRYTKEEAELYGVVKPNEVRTFQHLALNLPKQFVDKSGKSIEQIMAHYRDKYQVFKRAMEEIPLDTLNLVRDLINQGSLLDGTAHLNTITHAIGSKVKYNTQKLKETWLWETSYTLSEQLAKFKNTLIGVLCTELAEGMELNKACENWNKRVDPINYHKATAPITKRQIDEAKKFVEENGYTESFNRRLATIDDIKASEILHMNAGDGKIEQVSIFDSVKPSNPTRHKRAEFDKVEEISIEKFMKDILPTASSIEVFFENRMEGNLVAMTTAVDKDSKRFTKWNSIATNYSWTFNGNLAGKSQIKEAVKNAGGNVGGVMNFRLAWCFDNQDNSDLDLWAIEPNDNKIGFSTSYRKSKGSRSLMSGQLDVDNTNPGNKLAVENITWINKSQMKDGDYVLIVNQYRARNSQGFKVEIEIEGDTYTYEYNKPVRSNVKVATVSLKNGQFTITHHLPLASGNSVTKEIWKLETNNFHKVNLVCKSPNHWGDNQVGNLHYFFMLDKCSAEHKIRGFHNENLTEDLLKHRKVMEVLGATTMIEPSDKHLAGLGFNSTVKDELIVRCKGSHSRVLKIKF